MKTRWSLTPLVLVLLGLLPLAQAQAPLGSPQALPPLGSSNSEAVAIAINNSGQIIGLGITGSGPLGAVYWASPTAAPVILPGGAAYEANGINDAGLIVGVDENTGGPVYWTGPTVNPIALAAAPAPVMVMAINNNGEVVGLAGPVSGAPVLVEWNGVNGAPVVRASLPGSFSGCTEVSGCSVAVNDAGDIVVGLPSGSTYYLSSGAITPVQVASGGEADLNNFGNIIVGNAGYLAAFGSAGVQNSNSSLHYSGINDVGQVVGFNINGPAEFVPEIWRFVNAGANQTVSADLTGQAQVALSGSAVLPDGQTATTYAWSENGAALGSGSLLNVSLAVGKHTIVLTAGDGNTSMSAETVVTVQQDPLAPVENLINQEQTTLASDIGAVQTNTGTLLDTGAKEASVDALGGQLNAIAGTLAALTAANGSLANLANGQTAMQAGLAKLTQSQTAEANVGMERALANDRPLVLYELPASAGGELEQVAALAKLRVSQATAAGIAVGRSASSLLAQGDAAVTAGKYAEAFQDYARAYEEIGRSHSERR